MTLLEAVVMLLIALCCVAVIAVILASIGATLAHALTLAVLFVGALVVFVTLAGHAT